MADTVMADTDDDPISSALKLGSQGKFVKPPSAVDAQQPQTPSAAPPPSAPPPAEPGSDPISNALTLGSQQKFVAPPLANPPPAAAASGSSWRDIPIPSVPDISLANGPDLSHLTNRPVGGNLAAWWHGEQPPFQPPNTAPTPSPAALPDWAVHDTPQPPPKPASPPPKDTLGNMWDAVPSGGYNGVAQIGNYPTTLVNAGLDVMHGLDGQNYGHFSPPINTNPTNYEAIGPNAENIYNASSAATNTLAMGGIGKMAAPFLEPGIASNVTKTIADTRPSTAISAGVAAGAEQPIENASPDWLKPYVRTFEPLVVGGATSAAQTGAAGLLRAGPVSPQTIKYAIQANQMGIPVAASQLTDNPAIIAASSVVKKLPFSGMSHINEEAQAGVNNTAAKLMGVEGEGTRNSITPDVMNAARRLNGGVMEDVENRNNLNYDSQLHNNLQTVLTNAQASTTPEEFSTIQRLANGVVANVQPGPGGSGASISGTTYGSLMHKGSPLDAAAGSANPNIANAANDIKAALSDSLQRSLPPDDFAAYQQARTRWGVMKTIEPLTMGGDTAGVKPSMGDINPIALRAAVNRAYPGVAYAVPGQIPLNDLANVGQRFLKQPGGGSSTAHTVLGSGVGGIIGAGGEMLISHAVNGGAWIPSPSTAAAAAGALGAGAVASRGAGSFLNSNYLANRQIDKALNPPPTIAQSVGRAAVPLAAGSAVRSTQDMPSITVHPQPTVNPVTGAQQFNIQDAQKEMAGHKQRVAQTVVDQISGNGSHPAVSGWIDQNKGKLRELFGGQGINRIGQIASLMRRPRGTVFSVISANPSDTVMAAMKRANLNDPSALAARAIIDPGLAKVLAIRTTRNDLTRAGESQLIAALA